MWSPSVGQLKSMAEILAKPELRDLLVPDSALTDQIINLSKALKNNRKIAVLASDQQWQHLLEISEQAVQLDRPSPVASSPIQLFGTPSTIQLFRTPNSVIQEIRQQPATQSPTSALSPSPQSKTRGQKVNNPLQLETPPQMLAPFVVQLPLTTNTENDEIGEQAMDQLLISNQSPVKGSRTRRRTLIKPVEASVTSESPSKLRRTSNPVVDVIGESPVAQSSTTTNQSPLPGLEAKSQKFINPLEKVEICPNSGITVFQVSLQIALNQKTIGTMVKSLLKNLPLDDLLRTSVATKNTFEALDDKYVRAITWAVQQNFKNANLNDIHKIINSELESLRKTNAKSLPVEEQANINSPEEKKECPTTSVTENQLDLKIINRHKTVGSLVKYLLESLLPSEVLLQTSVHATDKFQPLDEKYILAITGAVKNRFGSAKDSEIKKTINSVLHALRRAHSKQNEAAL